MSKTEKDMAVFESRIKDKCESEMREELKKISNDLREKLSIFLHGYSGYQTSRPLEEEISKLAKEHWESNLERRMKLKYEAFSQRVNEFKFMWERGIKDDL